MNVPVIRDVVAVVFERRREERQQPEARDAEILQVVELTRQPVEVTNPIVVAVEERFDVSFVDDRVLEQERVVAERHGLFAVNHDSCQC